ncbi:MAG: sensor histidine kinase [Gaiellaceae bacterium]
MRLGVGVRLGLVLLGLILVVLGIVYGLVVPSLEDRVVDSRRAQLERSALLLRQVYGGATYAEPFVETAANSTGARALVLQEFDPEYLGVFEDSLDSQQLDLANDRVALAAYRSGGLRTGTVMRGGTRFIEVAVPLEDGTQVLLLSASLRESLGTVDFVERRLLTAGAIALLVALILGVGAATLHARRIRRLERSVDRIARGQFDEPVTDRGSDELGQLAAAFERMRDRLATLDHARREFVANASHELRTPIFALGAALELVDDEELDEATRDEFVTTAREQVERLTRLASDLLDLSRLDAGRVSVEVQPVDLDDAAAALAAEFEAAARAEGHPLVLEQNGRVPAVGDADQVLRVGRALVENALRHTPPGTRVCVRAERQGGAAVLEVEDDGPGIPPEHLQHVFDRFYRVDSARAHGSGLGLAIARELAELMNGNLELVASPRRTVFTLRLPTA